jgi:hypothetical protein
MSRSSSTTTARLPCCARPYVNAIIPSSGTWMRGWLASRGFRGLDFTGRETVFRRNRQPRKEPENYFRTIFSCGSGIFSTFRSSRRQAYPILDTRGRNLVSYRRLCVRNVANDGKHESEVEFGPTTRQPTSLLYLLPNREKAPAHLIRSTMLISSRSSPSPTKGIDRIGP